LPNGPGRDCETAALSELNCQRFGIVKIVVDYQEFSVGSHGVL